MSASRSLRFVVVALLSCAALRAGPPGTDAWAATWPDVVAAITWPDGTTERLTRDALQAQARSKFTSSPIDLITARLGAEDWVRERYAARAAQDLVGAGAPTPAELTRLETLLIQVRGAEWWGDGVSRRQEVRTALAVVAWTDKLALAVNQPPASYGQPSASLAASRAVAAADVPLLARFDRGAWLAAQVFVPQLVARGDVTSYFTEAVPALGRDIKLPRAYGVDPWEPPRPVVEMTGATKRVLGQAAPFDRALAAGWREPAARPVSKFEETTPKKKPVALALDRDLRMGDAKKLIAALVAAGCDDLALIVERSGPAPASGDPRSLHPIRVEKARPTQAQEGMLEILVRVEPARITIVRHGLAPEVVEPGKLAQWLRTARDASPETQSLRYDVADATRLGDVVFVMSVAASPEGGEYKGAVWAL